ncbi:MAG TPA: ice-binding family protein [Gammaproteobacteria bacterium]
MNTNNKYISRSLWLAAFLLTTLVTGCNSSNSSAPVSVVPSVTETSPIDTAIAVALNSKVTATFSEAMDATTIDTVSFTGTGAGEPALTGIVSLDAASNTASFTPGSNLTPDTVYTAMLTSNVKSSAGTALAANYVWSFTSGTTVDSVLPTASSTNPADAATGFAINRSVTVNFSEALDPATVNTSSFTLSNGGTPVSGVVSYSNRVATFNPASDLTPSTVYTVTLTTAITDLAANPLTANVVWSFTTGTALASGPAAVNLRTAGDFVILTKTGITNVPTSAITGNIGASPITAAAMDNVFCTEITGTIYGADAAYTGSGAITCFAGGAPDNTLVANAVLDMGTAYTDAAGRTTPDFTELHAGDISGQTLVPGLYKWGTGVLISTDVTLSGGPNDVWIFQIAGDITQADGSSILLAGGALAKNIFWQVGGGTGVAIGTGAVFEGVVLAEKGVTVNTGSTVNGRLLAQTAVTLNMNSVTQPAQ